MNNPNKPVQIEIQTVTWEALAPHAKRGALFAVAPRLDLAAVGAKITQDDAAAVGDWVAGGLLFKPSPEVIAQWEAEAGAEFSFVIVQPYVLCQKIQHLN